MRGRGRAYSAQGRTRPIYSVRPASNWFSSVEEGADLFFAKTDADRHEARRHSAVATAIGAVFCEKGFFARAEPVLQCYRAKHLELVGEEEADFLFVGLDAQGTARLKPFPLRLPVAGA